ncbi:hypothetical protein [Streptomyces sp. NPDC050121]|uniref:hypothetical protein n=1 Tax=Streptomyces sp. NPDC050121 TaxID=3365601 RepID=UPI0037A0BCE0
MYGKVLSGTGKRAVLLFNRTGSAANITVRWADLDLTSASAGVRNAWTRTDAGSFTTGYTTSVPANDAALLTVSGTEATGSTYEDTTTATTPTFTGVTAPAAGTKLVDITYANGGSAARKAARHGTRTLVGPPRFPQSAVLRGLRAVARTARSDRPAEKGLEDLRHHRPAHQGGAGRRPPTHGAAASPSCSTACAPRPPTRSPPAPCGVARALSIDRVPGPAVVHRFGEGADLSGRSVEGGAAGEDLLELPAPGDLLAGAPTGAPHRAVEQPSSPPLTLCHYVVAAGRRRLRPGCGR